MSPSTHYDLHGATKESDLKEPLTGNALQEVSDNLSQVYDKHSSSLAQSIKGSQVLESVAPSNAAVANSQLGADPIGTRRTTTPSGDAAPLSASSTSQAGPSISSRQQDGQSLAEFDGEIIPDPEDSEAAKAANLEARQRVESGPGNAALAMHNLRVCLARVPKRLDGLTELKLGCASNLDEEFGYEPDEDDADESVLAESDLPELWSLLNQFPCLQRLELTFCTSEPDPEDEPHIGSVTGRGAGDRVRGAAARTAINQESKYLLPQLKVLRFKGGTPATFTAVCLVLAAGSAPCLHTLALTSIPTWPAVVPVLTAALGGAPLLQTLSIGGDSYSWTASLSQSFFSSLSAAPQLRQLNLSDSGLDTSMLVSAMKAGALAS